MTLDIINGRKVVNPIITAENNYSLCSSSIKHLEIDESDKVYSHF